jgi:hypothetical protein
MPINIPQKWKLSRTSTKGQGDDDGIGSSSIAKLNDTSTKTEQINGETKAEGEENHAPAKLEDLETSKSDAPGIEPSPERPDILYCLTLKEDNKVDRSFYKNTPWTGVNTGLPGSDPEDEEESRAVLTYYVDAVVQDKTGKEPNTSKTWREQPADFEFGRDAVLKNRYWPNLKLYSKKLIKLCELVLDYYPLRGDGKTFQPPIRDTFVEFMYCYQELKQYLNTYRQSLPEDEQSDRKLELGSCGDEELSEVLRPYLDFGELKPEENPCDATTAHDIAVLLRLLAGMYRVKAVPILTSVYLDPKQLIEYSGLWLLFKPGTVVYVKRAAFWVPVDVIEQYGRERNATSWGSKRGEGDGEYSACVIASWRYAEKDKDSHAARDNSDHLEVVLWSIHYTGTAFQRIAHEANIVKFDHPRPLRDLTIVPARLYDKLDNGILRGTLEKRGHKYLSVLSELAAHRNYKHRLSKYEGQIIVDPAAYRQYLTEENEDHFWTTPLPPQETPILDGGGGHRFSGLTDYVPSQKDPFPRLNELCLLLPSRTEGFALRNKRWMIFEIEGISERPPVPSENQLDTELVLVTDADKESLRTVLPRGESPLSSASDFVEGKGEGKIFLLYGGPGTGKTLTVECVANDTCRPLLRLTVQDVRLENDVEANIRKWFTLAAKWDAILLIDEADLFLEQRKDGDLQRNSLSTIFLRTMEYYKGVLFLTTNRAGHIDDSFISRITCPIAYNPLSDETKAKIVEKFVKKFQETGSIIVEKSAAVYLKANCKDLNGRELRNVLQNAVATAEIKERAKRRLAQLAGEDLPPIIVTVGIRHISAAVERHSEFQHDLNKLRGGRDEATRARGRQDYPTKQPGSSGVNGKV